MQVADSILALQRQWKVSEMDELKRLIRYQLTLELTKMENRKRVRRDQRKKYEDEMNSNSEEEEDGVSFDARSLKKGDSNYNDAKSMATVSVAKTMKTFKTEGAPSESEYGSDRFTENKPSALQ